MVENRGEMFHSEDFVGALKAKLGDRFLPACSFCGRNEFTTVKEFASVNVNENFGGIRIGTSIPAGIVICKNCGHIDLFALGALGMLPQKDKEAVNA